MIRFRWRCACHCACSHSRILPRRVPPLVCYPCAVGAHEPPRGTPFDPVNGPRYQMARPRSDKGW
jgi:hypothetical protein